MKLVRIAVLALLLAGTFGTAAECPKWGTVESAQFAVAGISIGTLYEGVISALGDPNRVEPDLDSSDAWRTLRYPGMALSLEKDEVVHIRITSDRWLLPSGIRVGDPVSRVVTEYGCVEAFMAPGRAVYTYGVPLKSGELSDALLWFEAVDGVLVEIVLHVAHSRI